MKKLSRVDRILICLVMICLPVSKVCLGAPAAVHNVGTLSYQSDGGKKYTTVSNTVRTPLPSAEISLVTPASGSIGTLLTINGQGFMASERVRIDFGQISTIKVVTATSAGTFTTIFTIPYQPLGTKGITATGLISLLQTRAEFSLTMDKTYLAGNLNSAHCYPNPFKPNSGLGHQKITFTNLTDYTRLKIYNLAGELVMETEQPTLTGQWKWEAKNPSGEPLASGVYIYVITDNKDNKKVGKLIIIR